jgi:hypothetical protein
MPSSPFTIDGVTKPLHKWAAERGISFRCLRSRLWRGWSAEKALATPTRAPHLITYEDRTQSLAEWSREVGLSEPTINGRLRFNWSVAQALGFAPHATVYASAKMLTFRGETLCISDWAKRLGMSGHALSTRLLTWSVEKALTCPPEQNPAWQITTRGQTRTLAEWEQLTGVPRGTIKCRLKRGWTAEDAVFGRQRPEKTPEQHERRRARHEACRRRATARAREQSEREFFASLSKKERVLLLQALDNINGEVNGVSNE